MLSIGKYKQLLVVCRICILISGVLFCVSSPLYAQEFTTNLPSRNSVSLKDQSTAQRPTALNLPFFDDFTGYAIAPDPTLWKDKNVFLSNTFSSRQFSRGVAVFDANNAFTIPYDTLNPFHLVWADSLTSQDIDLSNYSPGDSLWLSFYYEQGGNGYLPKQDDSLILFFLNSNNKWIKAWQTSGGDTSVHFRRVMVPIKDTGFFHAQFAFRLLNKATHGISNSNWMVDYIYLNTNRHFSDTLKNDLAFTKNPGNLLEDFTAMPFNHFKTNPTQFMADSLHAFIKNNGSLVLNAAYGYQAKELLTGATLGSALDSRSYAANEQTKLNFPIFNFSNFNPPASSDGKVIIQTKYFSSSIYPNEPLINDTVLQKQVFGNYFAYDDGSAEKAYFLHVFPNAPGITALEYALYASDTLRGVSIYFPRTVPPSNNKEFSLIVYKDIAVNGGTDEIVYQQDYYYPEFQDSVDKFYTYRFDTPVPMSSGKYYIGVMQSAGGFSDSLYIGLDVNRQNGNHRYFNVEGYWESSSLEGALMVRPVVGKKLPPMDVPSLSNNSGSWKIFPNPADNKLYFLSTQHPTGWGFKITDIQGRILKKGTLNNHTQVIPLYDLSSGLYFFQVTAKTGSVSVQKFIKK